MLPMLPMPVVLGCLISAYTMGTQVARPIASLLKPVLFAASAGAAISRPQRGILGPFRLAGHALSFIFGFARNNSNSSTATTEMFKISATEELVSIYVRRDVYQITCSILYIVVFVGGSILIYKIAVYVIYKLYTDLRKSWSTLKEKNTVPEFSKEQLKAISQIISQAKTSSIKKLQKPIDIRSNSYTISD